MAELTEEQINNIGEDCERCRWWHAQGLSSRCPYHDGVWADEITALWDRQREAEKSAQGGGND